jgi:hypothetical protein
MENRKLEIDHQPRPRMRASIRATVEEQLIVVEFAFDIKMEDLCHSPDLFYSIINVEISEGEASFETLTQELKQYILGCIYAQIKKEYDAECEFLKYHYTGAISSDAYRANGVTYDIKGYPLVVSKMNIENGEIITFRKTGEKLRYVQKDSTGEIVYGQDGCATYMSDETVLSKNLNLYDTTIVAFNEANQSVALASDEWGADGIFVNLDYQRRGIGLTILTLFRQQFETNRQMGQMTDAGIRLAKLFYRAHHRKP